MDDDIIGDFSEEQLQAYKDDLNNYSILSFRKMGSPGFDTLGAFVTGHKYKINWQDSPDFE